MPDTPYITFLPQDGGGYVVYADDDRIGFVRQIGRAAWAATDSCLVSIRGTYATRRRAVAALLRRAKAKAMPMPAEQKTLTPGQRKLLEPFELHFVAMYQAIIDMSDDELAALLDAAIVPNQTNCWFITYWAAQFAEKEARSEQYSRERAKAEKADAS